MPRTRSMKKQDNAPVEVHARVAFRQRRVSCGTGAVPAPVFTYNTDFFPQPTEASSTAPRIDALAATENPSSELLLGETTPVRRNVETGPAPYAQVARSVRSTASSNAALRDMEYRAAKELAEIRRKRLDLEEELVKKKLARDVAQIEANSVVAANDLEDSRVSLWVENVNTIRGEPPSSPLPQPANRVNIAQGSRIGLDLEPALLGRINARVGIEEDERRNSEHYTNRDVAPGESRHLRSYQDDRSPTRREQSRLPSPYRHRSRSRTPGNKEKGIERLAEALEKMTRLRPASAKQAQELPVFSGSAVEWLAFKTAMKESTELYGFTHAENMGRLRVCLRGEARDAVSALLFTESDPQQIMRTLEQCFGRTETIIDKAIEVLRRLPRLGQTAQELNSFAVKLQNIVCIIRNVDGRGYLRNPMLVRYVSERLSPHLRSRWCDYAEDFGTIEEPEIVTMSKFLMREADRALSHAYTATPFGKTETTSRREKPREATILTTTPVKSETKHCLCCGGQHGVKECTKLSNMSVKERWAWAQEHKVCFNCLRSRHRRFTCKEKRCCINECRGRHHELLHAERASPTEQEGSATEETALVASTSAMCDSVLLKVCPVLIRGPEGREIATYALLDEGSTISLIDEQLAREIGANGPTRKLRIRCVSATNDHPNSRIVNLTIRGKRQEKSHEIKARTVKSLAVGVQTVSTECLQLSHLRGLPKDVCFTNAKPKLLIGADNWHLIISRNIRIGRRNEPIAANTLLGWVIQGTMPRKVCEEDNETVLHIRSTYSPRPEDRSCANIDDEINALLKRQYEIDSLGISLITKPRKLEERALNRFNDTVRKIDGRYYVGLPWKDDDVKTPPSYEMAARRLRSIERKMDQSQSFKEAYTAQVNNLLTKGYARLADGTEKEDSKCWYLPHFAVQNPNKPGKTRLVFDAAAKASGVCLNDLLLDGPDLLRNLPGVLYRFRENDIAVSADIREMFLQVKIDKRDQPAQMFLWRGDDRINPPREYVMTSMIFGARSSPFLAHSVRDYNARAHANTHQRALDAITKNHYMDDYLDSFVTIDDMKNTTKEVVEVHANAAFVLASWNSNKPEALSSIPTDKRATEPTEVGKTSEAKTLGLRWMSEEDALSFNVSMCRVPQEVKDFHRAPTKREALSAVMSIFDPLGLLSYITITAKIQLQDLWRMKSVSWDDELPPSAGEEFQSWLHAIRETATLRLPRCYASTGGVVERQLHVFNDASEKAYATVAYWRTQYEDGSVRVSLIGAKAKVAPIKAQSIPRLELQASLIGARLADAIQTEHRIKAQKVRLWTDSQTVLHWIRNDTSRYSPYVAHRLGEIAERTTPEQWRWVPSSLNIADQATRANFDIKDATDGWFTGPAFLYREESEWPQQPAEHAGNDAEERVNHYTKAPEAPHLPKIERFSSHERLIRATARVLQFIEVLRGKADRLELRHLKQSEDLWTKQTQKEAFSHEIELLRKGKPINNSSALRKLDPILENGLLRARGRINAAEVSAIAKRPVILDGRHPYTRLLVKRAHVEANHANRERVVNDLRLVFHITRLRPTVREVERSCMLCKVRKATPRPAVTGDLPPERLGAYARPFTYTGVDYFGPLTVTIGRRREKRWVALFTCLTTRAIHLELVYSLTTDSAIMALRRMAARRGWPRVVYSDNGTNFRGASKEINQATAEWEPALREFALTRRFDWKFIAPGAPNQGGAWERLVRSVKSTLQSTLREKHPKEDTLATLLAEAEHIVNSRPLTHVAVTTDDAEALTPYHFLIGGPAALPNTAPCCPADRKAWRAAQGLADEYWRRWVREYLPTLRARGESRRTEDISPRPGDMVIIADGHLPRNVWPRGIITRTFPGPDGVVRNVEIKTRGGLLRRPVRKVAVLPTREEASVSTPGGEC